MTRTPLSANEPILDEFAAARMLGISETTLSKWRLQGKGPPYYRAGEGKKGRILYSRTRILEWLESRIVDDGNPDSSDAEG